LGKGEFMYIALSIMLVAAMFVLFMCGYYVRLIKELGMNWLHAVPITVAILMFNIIWALLEMAKSSRWQ
jgi:chromate transport protein ChrA